MKAGLVGESLPFCMGMQEKQQRVQDNGYTNINPVFLSPRGEKRRHELEADEGRVRLYCVSSKIWVGHRYHQADAVAGAVMTAGQTVPFKAYGHAARCQAGAHGCGHG